MTRKILGRHEVPDAKNSNRAKRNIEKNVGFVGYGRNVQEWKENLGCREGCRDDRIKGSSHEKETLIFSRYFLHDGWLPWLVRDLQPLLTDTMDGAESKEVNNMFVL